MPPGHDHDRVRVDLNSTTQREVFRDRFAQGQDAVGRRVSVMAVGERLLGRLDDVLWRAEIRLADSQIDHPAASARKFLGAPENHESALRSQPAHRACRLRKLAVRRGIRVSSRHVVDSVIQLFQYELPHAAPCSTPNCTLAVSGTHMVPGLQETRQIPGEPPGKLTGN